MKALTQHELSKAFPAMSAHDLKELSKDIAKHGLRQPVVTLDGQVLDGWHRYQACLEADREPSFVEFEGGDPRAFVISQNAHRRQLTQSQKAASIVKVSDWKPVGSNQHRSGSAPGAEALAESAGVSTRTIEQAKRAEKAGLGDAVRDGKVSAKTADAVAALPEDERAEVVNQPPEDWQVALERKKPREEAAEPKDEEPPEASPSQKAALDELHERMADLADAYESLAKIMEADDKLAAAFEEGKKARAKAAQLERMYDGKCAELATMTKEAKRWMKKAQALEKQVNKGRAA